MSIGHFGGADYGDWKMTGAAFKPGPASGGLLAKLETENFAGNPVASSEIEGGRPMGTLASPEFKIARGAGPSFASRSKRRQDFFFSRF